MNDDAPPIKAALDRRFARAPIPACPPGAWRAGAKQTAPTARPRVLSRGFAYAAALLVVVAIGGLAAQAASTMKAGDLPFMRFFVSSKPLMPGIHRVDRLSIAEAQRRMPFPIVVPTGLPTGSRFLYAHVVSEQPTPRVALSYEAHIGSKYYRISVNESTVAVGPPLAHFELKGPRGATKSWDLPLRRWNHGAVVMDLFAYGLPEDMSDRIVRANTM